MPKTIKWTLQQAQALFEQPLLELLFRAQQIHRQHFDPQQVQISTLLSIKTGACPEDCKYCSQSARYRTGLKSEKLMEVEKVLASARVRPGQRMPPVFAWALRGKILIPEIWPYLEQMIQGVKAMGMETCMTLGTLDKTQAHRLANAGLDYYNHKELSLHAPIMSVWIL